MPVDSLGCSQLHLVALSEADEQLYCVAQNLHVRSAAGTNEHQSSRAAVCRLQALPPIHPRECTSHSD